MKKRYPICTYAEADVLENVCTPYGCTVKDGVLRPLMSSEKLLEWYDDSPIICAGDSPVAGGCLMLTENGHGYSLLYSRPDFYDYIFNLSASHPFTFVARTETEGNVLVLAGDQRCGMLHYGGDATTAFHGSLRCGTMRCGRLFGVDSEDGYLLKWSAPTSFSDWSEGIYKAGHAYISPEGGEICEVIEFNDELLLCRDYAITHFSAYGTPENFRVGKSVFLPRTFGKSYKRVGDKIYFCTVDGLHRYAGGKAEKIEGLISDDLTSVGVSYAFGEKYYIVCGNSRRYGRDMIYIYDVELDACGVVDLAVGSFASDGNSPIAFTKDCIYRLVEGEYRMEGRAMDFGTDKTKLATKIQAECEGEVYAEISNGRHVRRVKLSDGQTKLNIRGEKFTVTLVGTGVVRSAKLFAEVRA